MPRHERRHPAPAAPVPRAATPASARSPGFGSALARPWLGAGALGVPEASDTRQWLKIGGWFRACRGE